MDRAELVDVLVENSGSNPVLAHHHDATLDLGFFLLQKQTNWFRCLPKDVQEKVLFYQMAQLFQTDGQIAQSSLLLATKSMFRSAWFRCLRSGMCLVLIGQTPSLKGT